MGKNIERVQSMIDGTYQRKIQTGYKGKTLTQREEGEEWTDGNGKKWKIVKGKRKQITTMPDRGLDKCDDCKKLILKKRDQETWNRFNKCFYCQLNFECEMKEQGIWKEWVQEQEKTRWSTIEKEVQVILKEMKEHADQSFDKSIANSMTNENLSMKVKN